MSASVQLRDRNRPLQDSVCVLKLKNATPDASGRSRQIGWFYPCGRVAAFRRPAQEGSFGTLASIDWDKDATDAFEAEFEKANACIRTVTPLNDVVNSPHVAQLFRIEQLRINAKSGAQSLETVCGITSVPPVRRFAGASSGLNPRTLDFGESQSPHEGRRRRPGCLPFPKVQCASQQRPAQLHCCCGNPWGGDVKFAQAVLQRTERQQKQHRKPWLHPPGVCQVGIFSYLRVFDRR